MREHRVVGLKIDEWRAEENSKLPKALHNRTDSLERDRNNKLQANRKHSSIGSLS